MHVKPTALLVLALLIGLASSPVQGQGAEQAQMVAVHNLGKLAFGLAGTMPAKPDLGQLNSGSPNQKLLARAWYYGWALKNGTNSEKNQARTSLVDHLTRQEQWGHYAINDATGNLNDEILTTSHFQLWAAGMAGAYVFAAANNGTITGPGNLSSTPEQAVLALARRWWADEKAMWDRMKYMKLVSGQNRATLETPGARFTAAGHLGPHDLRDTILNQLEGRRPLSQTNWLTEKFFTGGLLLEQLFLKGIDPMSYLATPIPGEGTTLRSRDTLCIYRQGGEWLFYFPQLRVLAPMFWVQKRAGQPANAPLVTSSPWPTTPAVKPANFPGATLEPPIAGRGAGAVGCPPPGAISP